MGLNRMKPSYGILPELVTPPTIYWRSFLILYKDLEESLRYIDPSPDHLGVFSLRFYELLVRAATEFESICKDKVLELKLSNKKSMDFTIKDYYLLNAHYEAKLSKVSIGYLFPKPQFFTPLANWKRTHVLQWYSEYNKVKHNRVSNFAYANLQNVLLSIGAIFVLLDAFELCPPGNFSFLNRDVGMERIKSNPEWPIIIKKEYWNE